jgi:hypothetical protein
MEITKYYCDKCGKEGNIWVGDSLTNKLYAITMPKDDIYYGHERVLCKSMHVCKKCKEKYSQLLLELNNKWDEFEGELERSNNYTFNINIENTPNFNIDKFIEQLSKNIKKL